MKNKLIVSQQQGRSGLAYTSEHILKNLTMRFRKIAL